MTETQERIGMEHDGRRQAEDNDDRPAHDGAQEIRWLVMQSLKHRKWVLAVVHGDFSEYQVTELMSENVDLVVQYANYLNSGQVGPSLDGCAVAMLEQTRERFMEEQ